MGNHSGVKSMLPMYFEVLKTHRLMLTQVNSMKIRDPSDRLAFLTFPIHLCVGDSADDGDSAGLVLA